MNTKRLIYILFLLICATVSAKDYVKDAEPQGVFVRRVLLSQPRVISCASTLSQMSNGGLNYSGKTVRPGYGQLDGAISYINRLTYETGLRQS